MIFIGREYAWKYINLLQFIYDQLTCIIQNDIFYTWMINFKCILGSKPILQCHFYLSSTTRTFIKIDHQVSFFLLTSKLKIIYISSVMMIWNDNHRVCCKKHNMTLAERYLYNLDMSEVSVSFWIRINNFNRKGSLLYISIWILILKELIFNTNWNFFPLSESYLTCII